MGEKFCLSLLVRNVRLSVFGNRIIRKLFGPESEEEGLWRKLHKYEIRVLHSSPDIVRVIKRKTMRWSGEGEVFTRIWLEGPRGRDHCEGLGLVGRITLGWT
jgi:hypothetical protein